jgi:site-specific DNA-cytosine methylase
LSVRDLLEENVDEKYYLKEHQLKKLAFAIEKKKMQARRLQNKDVVSTLQARDYKDPKYELRGQSDELRLYDGVNPTINAAYGMGGGNVPLVMISSTQAHNSVTTDGICGTLPSAMGEGGGHIPMINSIGRFRKLTPKECFRLQGFTKDEINFNGISDSRAYKLCGNGQSVNVVKKIFQNMFILTKSEEGQARHSSQA